MSQGVGESGGSEWDRRMDGWMDATVLIYMYILLDVHVILLSCRVVSLSSLSPWSRGPSIIIIIIIIIHRDYPLGGLARPAGACIGRGLAPWPPAWKLGKPFSNKGERLKHLHRGAAKRQYRTGSTAKLASSGAHHHSQVLRTYPGFPEAMQCVQQLPRLHV